MLFRSAKKFPIYAVSYPFIETGVGFSFLFLGSNLTILTLALVVLLFNFVSLYGAFGKKDNVLCVCLGTRLAFPFDKWLILENIFMLTMVLYMIIIMLPGASAYGDMSNMVM